MITFSDDQKMKIFPATLKGITLRWFMGFGAKSIATWDDVNTIFLEKYQDYYKAQDVKEEILNIRQKEDENVKHFVEHF